MKIRLIKWVVQLIINDRVFLYKVLLMLATAVVKRTDNKLDDEWLDLIKNAIPFNGELDL